MALCQWLFLKPKWMPGLLSSKDKVNCICYGEIDVNKKHFKPKNVIIFAIPLLICLALLRTEYFDIYSLSLNGRVSNVRVDIKEAMYITVIGEEHILYHDWPKLQRNVKVGDSVYKQSKSNDIILVKKNGMKFICPREDK